MTTAVLSSVDCKGATEGINHQGQYTDNNDESSSSGTRINLHLFTGLYVTAKVVHLAENPVHGIPFFPY